MGNKKARAALIVLPVISVLVIIAGIAIGSVSISPLKIISVIIFKLTGQTIYDIDKIDIAIIWELRMPRVMLAFVVGAALSASGAVVQSALRNPLASPFTLGVSSGASLGAGIIIAFFSATTILSSLMLPLTGFIFGLLTVIISIRFASMVDRNLESTTIVLCGMVLSMFINAVFMLIAGISGDKMQQIIRWQMGSFSSKGWEYVIILFVSLIIGVTILVFFSKELDILTFGEEEASSIGVETKKVKWIVIIVSSALTGLAVSFAGVIGFIDLVAPHIVRRLFTPRHKYVIVLSALTGGILMVAADLVSRTVISPRELPVGAVTALIGAPFFAYVYFIRRKNNA